LRQIQNIVVENPEELKAKLLLWGKQYDCQIFLDSNNDTSNAYSSYDAVLAVDTFTLIKSDDYQAFDRLKEYVSVTQDWIFGYLSYDLKNDTDNLVSGNYDGLDFPELYFFQPKKIFLLKENRLQILYLNHVADEWEDDLKAIENQQLTDDYNCPKLNILARISRENYLEKVSKMLQHIKLGSIYEANFCMEFYSENVEISPLAVFQKLNDISCPPFSVFLNMKPYYLLSASPERFLRKQKNKIISQPVKGTAKRSPNEKEDQTLATELQNSLKERTENIMIADLVRNDLSKTASRDSVKVEELCGLYSFKQVHQLITTVVSEVSTETHPVDIIKSAFPMGSMTGVPKKRAMEIIEMLEETKRSLYSGAVGYFTPDGNFDFNVVIRSILYNSKNNYLSFSVGGAITIHSDPEQEYEECLLKARAMQQVLT